MQGRKGKHSLVKSETVAGQIFETAQTKRSRNKQLQIKKQGKFFKTEGNWFI